MFSLLLSACFNNTINTEKVVDSTPTINLLSPEEGEQFVETSPVAFSAMVRDDFDAPSEIQLSWSSSQDGEFNTDFADGQGSVTFEYDALSVGEHQITLQATNAIGSSISSVVNIYIVSAEQTPTIELLLPVEDTVEESIPALFKVRVRDPNYELEELTLSFTSDQDDTFCVPILENTEEAYCEAVLSVGQHSLEFTVTNPNQLSQSTTLDFSVLPPLQVDNDGDGFTEENGDCDDSNAQISPNGTEIVNELDDDCNGLIDDGTDFYDDDGDGFSENDGDCDDTNEQVFPSAIEICTGLDNDCNGLVDDETECYDDDQDGFSENDGDCDDNDFNIYPYAPEDVDGFDNNCDGHIDEGSAFFDDDSDCFCESSPCYGSFDPSCIPILEEGDCDDTDGAIAPNAPEYCDGVDTNCNNIEDDNPINTPLYYPDLDEDGYGDPLGQTSSCEPIADYVLNGDDCNDTEPLAWTGNTESCDGIDNDCNGLVDDNAQTTYYLDSDGDGYGNPGSSQDACSPPAGYVSNDDDCNDAEPLAWTGNIESCDGIDNDCNGTTDDNLLSRFYADLDTDTYGDPNNYLDACSQPAGYVSNTNDCNDTEPLAWTGNTETCDGVDNDCDGTTDAGLLLPFFVDSDGDGYGNPSSSQDACSPPAGYVSNDDDCNDAEPLAWTGNTETCDTVDNDCDGTVDNGLLTTHYVDLDGDGYGAPGQSAELCATIPGYVTNNNDCDDTEAAAWTNNVESCDEIDNNCNGQTDEGVLNTYYADLDGDGYGNATNTTLACSPPAGFVSNTDDCNDAEELAWSGKPEVCDTVDNNCNGQTDEGVLNTYYYDHDNDGYGDPLNTTLACSVPNRYVTNTNDCNDYQPLAWSGASEYCDTVDNNCDGQIDEINAVDCVLYHIDDDGDGYGDPTYYQCQCAADSTYVTADASDCYDANALAKPSQLSYFTTDRGDGSYDYNCDGIQSPEFTGSGSCSWSNWCNLSSAGWEGSTPSCGATGKYMSTNSHCEYDCLGFCCDEDGYTATQSCQ